MSVDVIVLGAGGHARVVIDALQRLGARIVGVVADEVSASWPHNLAPLLGDEAWLARHPRAGIALANGVGGLVPMGNRASLFLGLKRAGFSFFTVVHPRAIVAEAASIGEGSFVAAGAIVQAGARIAANCVINTGAIVDHDCRLSDHAQIAPGAVLAADVKVGAGAYVGAGATVLQGRTLGEACQVAAGAVVVKDVAPRALVLGVPARERRA
jgi:sugar O-acyltransferase (sialic acid O-acetyltransferase NeuD family)